MKVVEGARSQTGDGELPRGQQQQEDAATLRTEEIQGQGDVIEARSQGLPDRNYDLRERGYEEDSLNHRIQALLSTVTWS